MSPVSEETVQHPTIIPAGQSCHYSHTDTAQISFSHTDREQPLHLGIQLAYKTSQPSQENIHLWKSETSIPAVLMRLISQMKTMHIKRVFIKMLQGLWPVIEISRNYLLLVKK